MLTIAVPSLVLISGPHAQGRRDLAVAVAESITAALVSSDDIAGVFADNTNSIEDVIVAIVTRQIERSHNVVIECVGAIDQIAPRLQKVALGCGAKFAPVSCFDSDDETQVGEFAGDLAALSIEGAYDPSLSVAEGTGLGISVDTSRRGAEALRDVIAHLQSLDGTPMLCVSGCRFCDHDALRRRAESVLQNEWCMFSAEKIDGRTIGVVTPIRHVATVFDLTASEWSATGALLRAGLRHLDKEVQPDSFIVGWNTRPVTGGGTPHAQLRIVPYFTPVESKLSSTHTIGDTNRNPTGTTAAAATAAPTVWATVPPPLPAPSAAAVHLAPPAVPVVAFAPPVIASVDFVLTHAADVVVASPDVACADVVVASPDVACADVVDASPIVAGAAVVAASPAAVDVAVASLAVACADFFPPAAGTVVLAPPTVDDVVLAPPVAVAVAPVAVAPGAFAPPVVAGLVLAPPTVAAVNCALSSMVSG